MLGGEHKVFPRKKINFEKVAKFNYELDSNEELKNALKNLSLKRGIMSKNKYLSEMLLLFNKAGFDISLKELDMLLLFRQKTDQLLMGQNTGTISK